MHLVLQIFCPTEETAPPVSCSGSAIVEKLIALGFAATPEDATVLANRLVLVGVRYQQDCYCFVPGF